MATPDRTPLTLNRWGIALPAALAAVIVLAALAEIANLAARGALREASALEDAAQSAESRSALNARAVLQLSRLPRARLLAAPLPLGQRDTALVVTPLAWPWHQVAVTVAGAPVIAQFARALAPPVPWCAAVVTAGAAAIAPNTLSIDPAAPCGALQVAVTAQAISSFRDSLVADVMLPPLPDTVVVSGSISVPAVVAAQRRIDIVTGASVAGLVIAPMVHVWNGGTVRGLIVASDSLIVGAGAMAIADPASLSTAFGVLARLRLVGRGGILLPP